METKYQQRITKIISVSILIAAIMISVIITFLTSKRTAQEKNTFTVDNLSLATRSDFEMYDQYFDFHNDFIVIDIKSVIKFIPIKNLDDLKSCRLLGNANLGMNEKSEKVYREAKKAFYSKNYTKSIKLLESVAKINHNNKALQLSLLYTIGEILIKQTKYNDAYLCFDMITRLDRDNGNAYLLKGSCLIKLFKYTSAQKSYQRALHYKCENTQIAFNDLGCVALKNQNIADAHNFDCLRAFDYFNDAVAHDTEGKYEEIYINRGIIYMYFREFSKAIQDLNKAIDINPTNGKSYLNRAQAYIIMKQYSAALKDLIRAEELNNNFAEVIEVCRKDIAFLSKGV